MSKHAKLIDDCVMLSNHIIKLICIEQTRLLVEHSKSKAPNKEFPSEPISKDELAKLMVEDTL